jgi:MtfA peptidase
MITAEQVALDHLRLWPRMPQDWRERWHDGLQHFLLNVPFVGANGLQVTDDMRIVVGAHMSLAAIGLGRDAFASLHGITLYPDEFWVDEVEEDELTGVISESRSVLSGQSLGDERIVLSWQDVLHCGVTEPSDDYAYNVVIHEFTHHLQASRPHGDPEALALLMAEHAKLLTALEQGEEPTVLDPYGADSPEEFLAIAAEAFFEIPDALQREHPQVYDVLARSFRVDPLTW